MTAIKVTNIKKSYGDVTALDAISFDVPKGSVFGFLGPNGAGKTTLMKLLLGLIRPDSGSVELFGHNLAADRIQALSGIGALIEEPSLYPHLSGRDNLKVTTKLLNLPLSEIDRVLAFVDLAKAARRKAATYSMGMRQRLGLARAMLGFPRLLILDEPTNGLDPESAKLVRQLISSLPKETGCTVFLSSHVLSDVEKIVDHAVIMREGKIVLSKAMQDLIRENEFIRIKSSDMDRCVENLTSLGANIITAKDGEIIVRPPLKYNLAETLTAWNAHLVKERCSVSQIYVQPASLEDLYHQTGALSPRTHS